MVKSRTGSLTHTAHATMPNQSAFGGGARVLATFATPADLSVPSAPQRASCSLGTTSPTSATFRATSCAATGGASRAPGSATGCPTVLTRATRRNAVSAGALRGGDGGGAGRGGPGTRVLGRRGGGGGTIRHTLRGAGGRWPAVLPSPRPSSSSEEHGLCRNRGLGRDGATAVGEQRTPPPVSPKPHSAGLSLPSLCTRGI